MTIKPTQVIDSDSKAKNYAFPELQQLLQQVEMQENSIFHQPYFANKSKVLTYKITFFFFGLLFLALSAVIYLKNPNWLYYFFIMDGHIVKYLAIGFSLTLSSVAFSLAAFTRTEHEVAAFIEHQARRRLAKKYHLKCEGFCFFDSFPSGKDYLAKKSIKKMYGSSLEKIHASRREYDLLLKRIAAVRTVKREEKEKLFNQTLIKYNDFTEGVIISFNTLQITH